MKTPSVETKKNIMERFGRKPKVWVMIEKQYVDGKETMFVDGKPFTGKIAYWQRQESLYLKGVKK